MEFKGVHLHPQQDGFLTISQMLAVGNIREIMTLPDRFGAIKHVPVFFVNAQAPRKQGPFQSFQAKELCYWEKNWLADIEFEHAVPLYDVNPIMLHVWLK